MIKNILIINPFGIGDVLFSTPLVSVIRELFPLSYIGYICNNRVKDILYTNNDINEVFIFDRGEHRALWEKDKLKSIKKFFNFWLGIKRRRFDIVFDLSLGKEYAFFCSVIGIKERIGFDYKRRGFFLTKKLPFCGFNDKSVAEYYLDLVRARFDISKTKALKTKLITLPEDKSYIDNFFKAMDIGRDDILIGIAPGGGISFGDKKLEMRRWNAVKYSELADRIIDSFNAKVVLIWGPGEENLVERIKRLMKRPVIISPKTTVREMAELCSRLKLFICSEGGPLHIASSQGIRTISIFGPVDEKVYGPFPPNENNIVLVKNVDCRPCYKRFKVPECDRKICLEGVSVEDVFKKIPSIMRGG